MNRIALDPMDPLCPEALVHWYVTLPVLAADLPCVAGLLYTPPESGYTTILPSNPNERSRRPSGQGSTSSDT